MSGTDTGSGRVFDLAGAQGHRAAQLAAPEVTSMQLVLEDRAGTLWCTQTTKQSAGTGDETTRLTRLSPDGDRLDSMFIVHGGHGLSLAVDNDGTGGPTIYYCWPYSEHADLVRFPYRPGSTVRGHHWQTETVLGGPVGFFAVNFGADRIVIRDSGVAGMATCHLRRWSDVLAGVDNELAQIKVSTSHPLRHHTFQGMTTDAAHLYELTGDSHLTEPTYIWQYRWSDGSIASRRDISSYGRTEGPVPNNTSEPEGISFSAMNGTPTLLIGLSQGGRTNRRQLVYRFEPPAG